MHLTAVLNKPVLAHSKLRDCTREGLDIIEKVGENKTVKKLMGLITRDPRPERVEIKSEKTFEKYQGKIIRKITVKQLGFEQTVSDTSRVFKTFVARLANKIHLDTRASVVRNYMFVQEGDPLNPYRLADNERTLRNLDFILDAQIMIKPIPASSDSVDLLVITRDVFSLGGSISPRLPDQFRLGLKTINFAGLGQRIEYRQIYDRKRIPRLGYEFVTEFSNVGGTFVDLLAGYTQLNRGPGIGNENERSFYVTVSRGLFQPFARVAGAIELSDNRSRNVFLEPDTTFVVYHYKVQDYWVGYSFGYKSMSDNLRENRNRKFIAIRISEQRFMNKHRISFSEQDIFAYRDKVGALTQLSFFRQDFYKTQYVLGFGRTEDIPYGYRISITTGFEKELGLVRTYFGSEAYYDRVLKKGTILTYMIKMGTYLYRRGIEDCLLQFKLKRYSHIRQVGSIVLRHQLEAGYTILINQHLKRGVGIRDYDGIVGFKPDSLVGRQRLTLSQETVGYLPWKLLGFRLAPLARGDIALVRQKAGFFRARDFYAGASLGLRARNENLIFNTIEVRGFYYPKTVEGVGHFKFTITANLKFRYPNNYVSKPSTVFP